MPSYMDIHEIPGGVKAEDVAKAHLQDVKVQSKYGVVYQTLAHAPKIDISYGLAGH